MPFGIFFSLSPRKYSHWNLVSTTCFLHMILHNMLCESHCNYCMPFGSYHKPPLYIHLDCMELFCTWLLLGNLTRLLGMIMFVLSRLQRIIIPLLLKSNFLRQRDPRPVGFSVQVSTASRRNNDAPRYAIRTTNVQPTRWRTGPEHTCTCSYLHVWKSDQTTFTWCDAVRKPMDCGTFTIMSQRCC